MWSGKAAAKTFFGRFFDKKPAKAKEAEAIPRRKRSHSLFAPNMNALLTGDHAGGVMAAQSLLAGRLHTYILFIRRPFIFLKKLISMADVI